MRQGTGHGGVQSRCHPEGERTLGSLSLFRGVGWFVPTMAQNRGPGRKRNQSRAPGLVLSLEHAAELQGGPCSTGSGSVSLTCISNKFPGANAASWVWGPHFENHKVERVAEGQEYPRSDPPRPPRSTFQAGHVSLAAWGHLCAQGQYSGLYWPHRGSPDSAGCPWVGLLATQSLNFLKH